MRQIRPRTSYPAVIPPVPTSITVDLRSAERPVEPSAPAESDLRTRLTESRRNIATAIEQLALLIAEREGLKSRLAELGPPRLTVPGSGDWSIVPWALYEDDEL